MKDCRKCKDYRGCNGKLWYNYGEIRFCPLQILWVITNSEIMITTWPPNPEGSGYTDAGSKPNYKNEGSFAKPAGILAEVNARLTRAGTSGKLLRAEVLAELDLSYESKDALMYVKGWRRKLMSFGAWKKGRKYYQKVMIVNISMEGR